MVRAAGWEQVPASDGKWYEGYLAVGKWSALSGFVPKRRRGLCLGANAIAGLKNPRMFDMRIDLI